MWGRRSSRTPFMRCNGRGCHASKAVSYLPIVLGLGRRLRPKGSGPIGASSCAANCVHRDGLRAAPALVSLEPWQETHLGEAAAILQAAYAGGIEAEILALYRSMDGCRTVLDNIVNQGSCGVLVPEASAIAHNRGRSLGFVVVTEVAPRQGHLPQVAVLPEYQRQGIGRGLLDYSLRRLAEGGFETLSLIVSRANNRALTLYQAMGFQSVLAFPVGIWER